jgi:hypothetical protein
VSFATNILFSCVSLSLETHSSITPKTKRIKETKAKLAELFHVTDRKRPYWIQGAEWPAGKNSPMKYLNKKKISDGMVYVFSDVDTGEVREIIQYY